MKAKTLIGWIALMAVAAAPVAGQSLANRHLIELRMGAWNQVTDNRTEIGVGGVEVSVGSSGFIGGITYGYWFEENLALRVYVGGMAADVDTSVGFSGVDTEVAVVVPMLMGLKYYLTGSAPGSQVRPFVTGSAGVFVGSQSRTRVGGRVRTDERTEAAFGVEGGAGVDFLVGSRFLLGVQLTYDVMTDFDRPIGGSRNYSGPQLSMGFGVLLGG